MTLIKSYRFWNAFNKDKSTHGFMLRNVTEDTDITVVAFRGTNPFVADDWCTDMDISWIGLTGVGRVHAGFMKALGLQEIGDCVGWPKEIDMDSNKPLFAYYTVREALRKISRENKNAKFILTGHSLEGALAILFASVLILHEEKELLDKLEGVYTFGQPRVGDAEFGEFMKTKLKAYNVKYCRYVYCNDMVPRLPYDDKTLLFKHFGPCLYYNSFYKGQQLPLFTRELAEDGYSGVEVRVTPMKTEIIIRATRTQSVLGEKGRRIRELTSIVQKRFKFPENSVELYAEKVNNRGLCAIAQCESLRYKLLGGLAVRRACYGVLRFVMESGAKGCEVIVSGKLRAQRAKSMKFKDGYMISSGQPVNEYIDSAIRHVLLRQGVLGIKVKIMLDWDPKGKMGPPTPLPDLVTIHQPKDEDVYVRAPVAAPEVEIVDPPVVA